MATNVRYTEGDQLMVSVPAGIAAGEPLQYGHLPCVALTDRDADVAGKATVAFRGVFSLELAGAMEEDTVYIHASTFALSLADDADHIMFGVCVSDADADDMVDIRLSCCGEPGVGS